MSGLTKTIVSIVLLLVVATGVYFVYTVHRLNAAHSTFENYYAFRGCVQLLDKTDTYGDCKLANGSTIRIVKYQNKWYLDGDLPWVCVTPSLCFGI